MSLAVHRVAATLIVLATCTVLAFTLWHGAPLIAVIPPAADRATQAYSILSTLIESLASIFAITIAVIFLAVQIYTRPQYARAMSQLYGDALTWLVLGSFVTALAFDVILLARVPWIAAGSHYRLLDVAILLAGNAVALLIPLIAGQIANINPQNVARVLVGRITFGRIRRYRLSEVSAAPERGEPSYKLHVYGYLHGRDDPLAPYHEIVMWAVGNRDRVALSALTRLLLSLIASAYGVPYPRLALPFAAKRKLRRLYEAAFRAVHRQLRTSHGIEVTLFVLTYVVRRAQRLIKEWDGMDVVRQQYILNVRDLIDALATRKNSSTAIRLCLFAVMHICLSYSEVKRYGEDEALRHFYTLAGNLRAKGLESEATLCVQILAVICQRTAQVSGPLAAWGEKLLTDQIRECYLDAASRSGRNPEWAPGDDGTDPWRYRLATYSKSQQRPLIIIP